MGWSHQVLVLVLVLVAVRPSSPTICEYSQCNCTRIGSQINAACVFNSNQRKLDITSDTLPRELAELKISGPREMVIFSNSFSRNLTFLNLVQLSDVETLTVERRAFARLSYARLLLEVSGAQLVILEKNAFHELQRAVVSATLDRIQHLVVQEHAFDRLLDLTISQVDQLELQDNALFYNPEQGYDQGPATKITLDRVRVKKLPYNVFPALNQLHIRNSEVDEVQRSAFQAITFTSVVFENTTIRRLGTEAFPTRAVIGLLRFDGVVLSHLEPNCLQTGVKQLVIRGSTVTDVDESAFSASVGIVRISENIFNRVRSRGFTLKETTMLAVENNQFNILEDSAFVLPEGEIVDPEGQIVNVTFRGNSFGRAIGRGVLNFSRKNIGTIILNNSFYEQCQCENTSKIWLREKINESDRLVDLFYESSLCHVNKDLSRCFSIPVGMFLMENFSNIACELESQYFCPEVIMSDAAVPSLPGVSSDLFNNSSDRERKVLGSIFIFVISGIILMLFFSGFMWLRRKGYCTKARLLLLPSADSLWNIISRMFTGSSTTTASGIAATRVVSGHDYAELQLQRLGEDSSEEDVSVEDKATQTLPEELTQELLQSLRDKLDDPDNYGEARDMIEHLYDLIKVEESCNQNNPDFTSLQIDDLEDTREGENVYDVIKPKIRTKNRLKERKSMVTVGTRAPSPDKLLPLSLSRRKPAVLCDYQEPRDRQQHVYQELAGAVLTDYQEPPDSKPHLYTELPSVLVNRPLPSKPGPSSP